MAERARMVGGTLTIESEPNAGTRIALSIPVAREAVRRTHATEPPKVNA
jgi:nitrate/nitrite-specific signal transduction histidine kinase